MRTFLLLSALGCSAVSGVPVQIVSGTVTLGGGGFNGTHSALFDLVTDTGSLTGFSRAGSAYPDLFFTQSLPLLINTSLLFGGGDASMTIVHLGNTFSFEPREVGISPDQMYPGSFAGPIVTLTATGPLTFTVPFTASLDLSENFQFNQATEQRFLYSGAGLATLSFTRSLVPGTTANFVVGFDGATFAFVPEPGSGALVLSGLGTLALILKARS